MYTGMLHLHSGLRWIILVLLLIVIFRSLTAGSRPFNDTDRKLGLFTMIACDIMLLVGLYLWFVGAYGLNTIESQSMKDIMTNKVLRFFTIEHFTGMLIAIALVHVGKSVANKKLPDTVKHKRTLIFFGLALLIILISIPWPFREVGAGKGWF
ncbi:MAG: hypothetical protein JST09_07165 [Bacteroidetes bacterium]|nr:hypothetical protein [Bacteroidota bacterium]